MSNSEGPVIVYHSSSMELGLRNYMVWFLCPNSLTVLRLNLLDSEEGNNMFVFPSSGYASAPGIQAHEWEVLCDMSSARQFSWSWSRIAHTLGVQVPKYRVNSQNHYCDS